MSSPATERCRDMLVEIARLMPALDHALQPGMHKSRAQNNAPNEDQVAAFQAERAERHLLKTKYLPESAAPANLDIVMAISDVKTLLTSAYSNAMQMAGIPQRCFRCNHLMEEHGGDRGARCQLCEPCPGFGLTYVTPSDSAWSRILTDEIAAVLEPMIDSALRMAENALGDHDESYLLMLPCPWCEGKTKSMPDGSLTIRVFIPGSSAQETYAVCQNPNCAPPAEDCEARKSGRPMWRFHELDWLSQKIEEHDRYRKLAERVQKAIAG